MRVQKRVTNRLFHMHIDRRQVLIYAGATGVTLVAPGLAQSNQSAAPPRPPALDPALVKEFVGAGHGNLDKTRAMLEAEPGLLNAAWDWGGGDWEMAIGGAGHMGRADIAEFLISRGSRFDIFVAAMLGRLEIVKVLLAAYPNLAQSKGPHGISLVTHAEKGGERAKAVLDHLKSL
jgi:hypothetical protein